MRGTGPVKLNATTVYAYFTTDAGTLRLRVSCDEWDLLGLCEGQRVRVVLPDEEPQNLLVLVASRTPPVVWVELRAQAGRAAG